MSAQTSLVAELAACVGLLTSLAWLALRHTGAGDWAPWTALAVFGSALVWLRLHGRESPGTAGLERALRESEERHRAVSELSSDYAYVFRVDQEGSVTVEWLAGAFRRITGYTPEEVESLGGGTSIVHPDDRPIAFARLQTLVSGQADTSEFRIVTKSGEVRWIRESGRPVWDSERRCLRVYGAAQDITERRLAEDAARQREAELAHVLRVGTIGEMAAGLAHEINQPLAAIVSYARGCARRIRAGSTHAQEQELLAALEEIVGQALRADEIVRRLKGFVRKEEPRRERADVNALVLEVARLVRTEALDRRVAVGLRLEAGLPPVDVDRIQVEQVVLNLVRNALEAMDGVEEPRRTLTIRTSVDPSGCVEVSVCDAGEGIAPEDLERVFDPFVTTKPRGLGMGLAIGRTIVAAHGGRLWAERNPERGVTFRFTVPVGKGG